MRIFLLSLLIFIGLPSFSQAGDICKKAASTADIMKCKTARHADIQEALKTRFDALVKSKSGEELEALRDVHSEWLSYRDSECALEADQVSEESLRRIQELRCLIRVTEERLMALENLKETEEPHETAEISSQPRWKNAVIEDHADVYWRFGEIVEGDFDCDEAVEFALSGVRINAEDSTVQPVIVVSENPTTGRPKNTVIDIVAVDEAEDESCSASKSLRLEEITENLEEDQCPQRIVIADQKCTAQSMRWDGKSYVFD